MFFYFILFIITISLFYLANKSRKKENFIFFFSLFAFIPSFIGGMRDTTIGIDLQTYAIEWFYRAQLSPTFEIYINQIKSPEYGYLLLNYICSQFGDINLFFFVCELIKIALIGLTLKHFNHNIYATLSLFIYMLFAYWLGLSMMRQSIALCICFYSLIFFFEKKYIKFIFTCIIAYTFHCSALAILLLLIMDWMRKFKFSLLINIFLFIFIISKSVSILIYISSIGLVKSNMADLYINSGVDIPRVPVVISLFCLIYTYFHIPKKHINNKDFARMHELTRINALYAIFFLLMSSIFEVAFRIAYYQTFTLMILMSYLFKNGKKNKINKLSLYLYIILFIYLFYVEGKHGLVGTIPYKSSILGI